MASSTHQKPHHHLPIPHGATAAPPPTPSTQSNVTSDATADVLSRLLNRLPPTLSLSLPTRRSSPLSSTSTSATITPPVISLSDPNPILHSSLLSASQEQGFFQVIHHLIPSHLPPAADSTSLSLFDLPHHQKRLLFPNNWPLGFDSPDIEDNDNAATTSTTNGGESFCLNSSCTTESTTEWNVDLASLREFTSEMEKLELKVMEELAFAAGFENPARDDPSRVCSLMWISDGPNSSRVYPYVVGLHYQIRCQKHSLLSDSGWIHVSHQMDSVLVTLGDIAQVWSNGKFKKVRGRPVLVSGDDKSSRCISMSLLITLPVESTVSPQIPKLAVNGIEDEENDEDEGHCSEATGEEKLFDSFSFEDYAWRVYHERLFLKDPLVRYRI